MMCGYLFILYGKTIAYWSVLFNFILLYKPYISDTLFICSLYKLFRYIQTFHGCLPCLLIGLLVTTSHKSKSQDHKMSQLGKFPSSDSKDIKNHLLWFYVVYIYVDYSFGNWSNKWEISSAQVIIIIYVLFVLMKNSFIIPVSFHNTTELLIFEGIL